MTMTKDRTINMTTGKPMKLILTFAVPVIFNTLLGHLYGMMDTVVVGQFIGADALAAVGLTGSITYFVSSIYWGFMNGFRIMIAQHFGSGDRSKMRRAICVSAYLCAILAVAIVTLGLTGTYPLLRLMHTPEGAVIDMAAHYLMIIFLGVPFIIASGFAATVMMAMGDAKSSLYAHMISGAVNIGLDFLLVGVFHFGVEATAVTTVLADAAWLIYCLLVLRRRYRKEYLTYEPGEKRFDGKLAGSLLRLGVPIAVQGSVSALGVMIMQGKINSLGPVGMAAYTAGSKIDTLLHQPAQMISSGLGVFAAQNFGAKQIGRIRDACRKSMVWAVGLASGCAAIAFFLGGSLVRIFLDASAVGEIHEAATYLQTIALFLLPLGAAGVLRVCIEGMGDTTTPTIANFVELVVQLLLMFTVFGNMGLRGIVLAGATVWLLDLLFMAPLYWRRMRKVEQGLIHTPEKAVPTVQSKEAEAADEPG